MRAGGCAHARARTHAHASAHAYASAGVGARRPGVKWKESNPLQKLAAMPRRQDSAHKDAPPGKPQQSSLVRASRGVLQPRHLRGRSLSHFSMRRSSPAPKPAKELPLGWSRLMSPLVFSLVPRSQEW